MRVPAPTSTATTTTTNQTAQQGLPTCAEIGELPSIPAGAKSVPTTDDDNPLKCEWHDGDTVVEVGLWEYEKAPMANAGFTNMLMLCPAEEIDPVAGTDRSAWCGRKQPPACNLVATQDVYYLSVTWVAPEGTDEASCQTVASKLGGEVSVLLG